MNKILGATAIVAGTSIGAGMLALPIALYTFGPLGSMMVLSLFWYIMYQAGTVFMDLNLSYPNSYSVSLISQLELGNIAKHIASFCLLGLSYALLSAYMVGISSVLQYLFEDSLAPAHIKIFTFITFILMAGIVTNSIEAIDISSRVLLLVKLIIFLVTVQGLNRFVQHSLLSSLKIEPDLIAIPVVFTSFGFHGAIPSIINYLDRDRPAIKTAFFWGSIIPLIVYICWCLTILSIVPGTGELSFAQINRDGGNLGNLIKTLNQLLNITWLAVIVAIFSLLSIFTSFLGVGIGLFDFYRELIETRTSFVKIRKSLAAILTFTPPLIFTHYYPTGFILALKYAALALAVLAIIAPVLVDLKRQYSNRKNLKIAHMLKLIGLLLIGMVVVTTDVLH